MDWRAKGEKMEKIIRSVLKSLRAHGGRNRKERIHRFKDKESLTQSTRYWKKRQIFWLVSVEFQNYVWSIWCIKKKILKRKNKNNVCKEKIKNESQNKFKCQPTEQINVTPLDSRAGLPPSTYPRSTTKLWFLMLTSLACPFHSFLNILILFVLAVTPSSFLSWLSLFSLYLWSFLFGFLHGH